MATKCLRRTGGATRPLVCASALAAGPSTVGEHIPVVVSSSASPGPRCNGWGTVAAQRVLPRCDHFQVVRTDTGSRSTSTGADVIHRHSLGDRSMEVFHHPAVSIDHPLIVTPEHAVPVTQRSCPDPAVSRRVHLLPEADFGRSSPSGAVRVLAQRVSVQAKPSVMLSAQSTPGAVSITTGDVARLRLYRESV